MEINPVAIGLKMIQIKCNGLIKNGLLGSYYDE